MFSPARWPSTTRSADGGRLNQVGVSGPTGDDANRDDIVERAIAILGQESHSWATQKRRTQGTWAPKVQNGHDE